MRKTDRWREAGCSYYRAKHWCETVVEGHDFYFPGFYYFGTFTSHLFAVGVDCLPAFFFSPLLFFVVSLITSPSKAEGVEVMTRKGRKTPHTNYREEEGDSCVQVELA